jgi:hypothetical protein
MARLQEQNLPDHSFGTIWPAGIIQMSVKMPDACSRSSTMYSLRPFPPLLNHLESSKPGLTSCPIPVILSPAGLASAILQILTLTCQISPWQKLSSATFDFSTLCETSLF